MLKIIYPVAFVESTARIVVMQRRLLRGQAKHSQTLQALFCSSYLRLPVSSSQHCVSAFTQSDFHQTVPPVPAEDQ